MIEQKSISIYEYIGKAVATVNYVEFLASQIISRYYIKSIDENRRVSLIEDVLSNENAQFALINDVLKRVLTSLGIAKKRINNLHDKMVNLGILRNQFAHELLLLSDSEHWVPDRRKRNPYRGEGTRIKEKFDQIYLLYKEIVEELNKIIRDEKIEKISEIPKNYEPPSDAAS